jgi:hypothetical protein
MVPHCDSDFNFHLARHRCRGNDGHARRKWRAGWRHRRWAGGKWRTGGKWNEINCNGSGFDRQTPAGGIPHPVESSRYQFGDNHGSHLMAIGRMFAS